MPHRITALLALLLLLPLFAPLAGAGDVPHPSIRILSDDDLTPANGVTGGSGTGADPYVIEDLLINGPSTICIELRNTRKHLLVRNVTCEKGGGASMGVQLVNVTNVTFEHTSVTGQARGMTLYECEGVSISNCTITRGNLLLRSSSRVRVQDTSVTDVDPSFHHWGVEVDRSDNCTIQGCSVSNASMYGLYVHSSEHLRVARCTLEGFGSDAVFVTSGTGSRTGFELEGNEISDCRRGFILSGLTDVTLVDNTIRGNDMVGMQVHDTQVGNLSGNAIERHGILLAVTGPEQAPMVCQCNTVSGRPLEYVANASDRVIDTDAAQVILVNLTDSRLVDYDDPDADFPVSVLYCRNVTVACCELEDGIDGVSVVGGRDVGIEDTLFANLTDDGVIAMDTDGLSVFGNHFSDCDDCVDVRASHDVSVVENAFRDSSRGIMGDEDPSPEVWEGWNLSSNSFDGLMYGISVFNLANATVQDNQISCCSRVGLQVLETSTGVVIEGNRVSECTWGGIGIGTSTLARVANNTVQDCEGGGIGTGSIEEALLVGNVLRRLGGHGIQILTAVNTTVTRNVVSECQGLAVLIDGSGNAVHLNCFLSNALGEPPPDPHQVLDEGTGGAWDDGRHGNLWSDYQARYPAATNDGVVWDTPYRIDTGSTAQLFDRYPLVVEPDLEPPVARTSRDVEVDEGTTVAFDGTGSRDDRGITSYVWSFEHGGTPHALSGKLSQFDFEIPGTYVVTLNVSDAFGNWDEDTMVVTVRDALPPVADAGADLAVDQFGNVTLDGGLSYDTSGIRLYRWDVSMGGEDVTLYGAKVRLACDFAGTFVVTLTVTDNANRTDSDELILTVRDRELPVVDLADMLEATLGVDVTLDGSACSDNVGVAVFNWTFTYEGGLVTLEGPTPSYAFHRPGEYPVTLVVADAEGNTASGSTLVVVRDVMPPVYVGPYSGVGHLITEDLVLVFNWTWWEDDDPAFPAGANFTWSFSGDAGEVVVHGEDVSVVLPGAGMYEIRFIAKDASGNTAEHEFYLQVDWRPTDVEPPVADAGDDVEVELTGTVVLRGSYTPGDLEVVEFSWSLAGKPDTVWEALDHTFTAEALGEVTFVFRVRDWMGNEGNDTVVVSVLPRAPVVGMEDDALGTLSGVVTVRGTATGDVGIASVEYRVDGGDWRTANGTSDWSFSLDTTMLEDGNHTLEVRAWDGHGHGTVGPMGFSVSNPTGDGGGDDGVDEPPPWPWWVLVAAVVVLVLALVVWKRR